MAYGGFLVMIVTGVLLFCGDPVAFYNSIFFKVKMLMLLLAGLNVWLFNATVGRKMAEWEIDAEMPGRAKAAAVVSLVLWVSDRRRPDGRSRIPCHPVGGSPGMSLSSLLMSFCEWPTTRFRARDTPARYGCFLSSRFPSPGARRAGWDSFDR